MTTTVVNSSVFRAFFKKQKHIGPNFIDWYLNLRIVLSVEDKLSYLEQPIHAMPVPLKGQVLPSDVLNTHSAWVKASKEIAGLMLMTMDPDIQKNLEQLGAYDMLKELKTFIGKTVTELHAMLKLHKQTLQQKDVAPALHAIRAGKVQKNKKKKPHKAAKGNQGKANMGYAHVPAPPFAHKPKNPLTPKKDYLAKNAICHQCCEVAVDWEYLSSIAATSIHVTWARPIGMKDFAMWDWGHRVTWGVGGVNGTVLVRGSVRERAVGR
nr:hypothetical protein [Tanacetum cinerariifolium]